MRRSLERRIAGTSRRSCWNCGSKCIGDVTAVKACNGETTASIVGQWDGQCVVAFEGSQTFGSFIQDIEVAPHASNWSHCGGKCWVHSGFLKEWRSHEQCVKSALVELGCGPGSGVGLRMTGHSLGAGVDLLAMVDLNNAGYQVAESYHFGTPRSGSDSFARMHDAMFVGRSWRVTHAKDPVPELPPRALGWVHVEPEVYYRAQVADGSETCDVSNETSRCIEQHRNLPKDIFLHHGDHLMYMDVDLDNGVEHGCAFGLGAFERPRSMSV